MKLIINNIILFVCLFALGCQNPTKDAEKSAEEKSKELNDAAMNMQLKAKDSLELLQSLYFLDQAIQADSNNMMAYSNKLNTLLQLKKEDKALQTLQEINKRKPIPEFVMFEGFINDRKEDTATAHQLYTKAIHLYEEQFQSSKDSVLLLNKGFAILMNYGRDSGLHYFQSIKNNFQHIPIYEDMVEQAENFDKKEFLNNLW